MLSGSFSRRIFEGRAYLRHLLQARQRHGVHSPLVYHLMTQVLLPDRNFYCFSELEEYRSLLLKENTMLEVHDLGAGSRAGNATRRSVSSIAANALQPKASAQMLFRLCNFFQPSSILELGTSLGLTTAYLAKAAPHAHVISIEGSPAIAERARRSLSDLYVSNASCITGSFDDRLPEVLREMPHPDFVLIDGNHRYEPTMRYFQTIMRSAGPQSVLVFDDIHWSPEMEQAWKEMAADSRVRASLDFFEFGMILLDPSRQKEHFLLRLP